MKRLLALIIALVSCATPARGEPTPTPTAPVAPAPVPATATSSVSADVSLPPVYSVIRSARKKLDVTVYELDAATKILCASIDPIYASCTATVLTPETRKAAANHLAGASAHTTDAFKITLTVNLSPGAVGLSPEARALSLNAPTLRANAYSFNSLSSYLRGTGTTPVGDWITGVKNQALTMRELAAKYRRLEKP